MTPFWQLPLSELNVEQWEQLCDGCGKCCLHKLIDDDSDILYQTSVACKLLTIETAQCSDYANRKKFVPDCVKISLDNLPDMYWLPDTCAYRLRLNNQSLPSWHYLISGDLKSVHLAGASVIDIAVSESEAGDELEDYIIAWLEIE